MQFMVIIKADAQSESGQMPSEALLRAMGDFNEELLAAGVLVDGNGLMPSSEGVRITLAEGDEQDAEPVVVDGPFAETKELVGGFWIFEAESLEDAATWAKRVPTGGHEVNLEVRRVVNPEDFGEEFTPELREREERMRKDLEA